MSGLSSRDYQLLAAGWNAAVSNMKYPDGTPVEIEENVNPYLSKIDKEES